MHELIAKLAAWYSATLQTWGVGAIGLMMALESTIVPIPSELIIPPAAHLAYTGKISMSITGIIIAGALGSWLGATVMYWAARLAGRPLVLRFGKYFLMSPEKIEGAERWAANYGAFGIFAARLLPVVRHLIGIPAGLVRMNFWKFSAFTLLGSALWCAVLCWLGVNVGGDISQGEMHKVTFWLVGFLAVIGVMYYFFVHRQMRRKPSA